MSVLFNGDLLSSTWSVDGGVRLLFDNDDDIFISGGDDMLPVLCGYVRSCWIVGWLDGWKVGRMDSWMERDVLFIYYNQLFP